MIDALSQYGLRVSNEDVEDAWWSATVRRA